LWRISVLLPIFFLLQGQAITLAASGAGALTSFAGSQYTVATAAAESIGTTPPNNHGAATFELPSLLGLVTVVGSAIVGALLTI
jgi:hypothetical protein